jgi:hypothetical protein
MQRLRFRYRLFTVLVPVVALACFAVGTAQASTGAALKVTCSSSFTTTTTTPKGTSTTTETSTATLSARISRKGTSRSTASGGKVRVGDKVTCKVEVADPDTASAVTVGFTPAASPPGGERTDEFIPTTPGDGTITYTLTNGDASITFTFKYKIVV